jgi:hypothetical protein
MVIMHVIRIRVLLPVMAGVCFPDAAGRENFFAVASDLDLYRTVENPVLPQNRRGSTLGDVVSFNVKQSAR